jgi:energy-coupling factor transport system permease protein
VTVLPGAAYAVPRLLHPGAWWLWALALATAASRTTNPLLLALVITVAGVVVSARRTDAPWARSYAVFLRLGLAVVAIRIVFQAIFGAPVPDGRVLLDLPEVPLPEWAAGVRLGGAVTLEGVAGAAYDGLRLATVLVCMGAANALASPARLLRCMPGVLYEMGVAVIVAMTFAPQVVSNLGRVRAARRLRGRPDRGLRGLRHVAMPVLEGALERSLELAAAMDSRGYGRRASVPAAQRRATVALMLGGLVGVCAGVYGLLDGTGPAALGLPLVAAGVALAATALALGGRRSLRTRYRPDPWGLPEWLVAGSGALAAAVLITAAAAGELALYPLTQPLAWPQLPPLPTLGILAAALPALAAPLPPRPAARRGAADLVGARS